MDRYKIMKMVVILAAITVIASSLIRMMQRNSMSLTEYEEQNKDSLGSAQADSMFSQPEEDMIASSEPPEPVSSLIGATLNGSTQTDSRVTYSEGFYYEPVSDNLRRYISGISLQASREPVSADADSDSASYEISADELRYVHIWHFDFDGNPVEGELICNEYIAQDLVEIFCALYRSEYQLESVRLVEEFDGDDIASMEANNSSCLNYREKTNGSGLSMHAYGLAVDINPYYNPYISYLEDGSESVLPAAAVAYADRSQRFPYKIDEEDLCCKLFLQHGFIWGGNWNSVKDYQHFQKSRP